MNSGRRNQPRNGAAAQPGRRWSAVGGGASAALREIAPQQAVRGRRLEAEADRQHVSHPVHRAPGAWSSSCPAPSRSCISGCWRATSSNRKRVSRCVPRSRRGPRTRWPRSAASRPRCSPRIRRSSPTIWSAAACSTSWSPSSISQKYSGGTTSTGMPASPPTPAPRKNSTIGKTWLRRRSRPTAASSRSRSAHSPPPRPTISRRRSSRRPKNWSTR